MAFDINVSNLVATSNEGGSNTCKIKLTAFLPVNVLLYVTFN